MSVHYVKEIFEVSKNMVSQSLLFNKTFSSACAWHQKPPGDWGHNADGMHLHIAAARCAVDAAP